MEIYECLGNSQLKQIPAGGVTTMEAVLPATGNVAFFSATTKELKPRQRLLLKAFLPQFLRGEDAVLDGGTNPILEGLLNAAIGACDQRRPFYAGVAVKAYMSYRAQKNSFCPENLFWQKVQEPGGENLFWVVANDSFASHHNVVLLTEGELWGKHGGVIGPEVPTLVRMAQLLARPEGKPKGKIRLFVLGCGLVGVNADIPLFAALPDVTVCPFLGFDNDPKGDVAQLLEDLRVGRESEYAYPAPALPGVVKRGQVMPGVRFPDELGQENLPPERQQALVAAMIKECRQAWDLQ